MRIAHRIVVSLACALALCATARAQSLSWSEKDIDNDGVEELIVETRYYSLTFERSGGRCSRMIYKKTGEDLTRFMPYHTTDPGGGVFEDMAGVLCFDHAGLRTARYEWNVRRPAEDKLVIELLGNRAREYVRHIVTKKEITLSSSSPLIEVKYTITNQDTHRAQYWSIWSRNLLRPGAGRPQEQTTAPHTWFLPTSKGVKTCRYLESNNSSVAAGEGLRDGWVGSVADNGNGFALQLDYPQLERIWVTAGNAEWTDVWWRTRKWNLTPKRSVTFELRLLPFTGLKGLSGVAGERAGDIRLSAGPSVGKEVGVTVQVASGVAWKGSVGLEVLEASGKSIELGKKELSVAGESTGAASFSWKPESEGWYMLKAEAAGAGENRPLVMEKMVAVGKPQTEHPFKLEPVAERLSDEAPPLARLKIGGRLPDQIDWHTPSAAGRKRVLAVDSYRFSRQWVDVALRFDLEIDVVPAGDVQYRGFRTPAMAKTLHEALLNTRYDVLYLSGVAHTQIPDETQALILEKVKEGMGILWEKERPRDKALAGHPSLLKKALPGKAGLGKGRVVFSRFGGRAFVSYAVPLLTNKHYRENVDHEYYMMRLGKMVMQASGYTPAVTLGRLQCRPDGARIAANNTTTRNVNQLFLWQVRDDTGKVVRSGSLSQAVAAGQAATVEVAFDELARAGKYDFIVRVMSESGTVIDCGHANVKVESGYKIASLSVGKDRYDRGEKARLVVKVEAQDARPATVTVSCNDAYDRHHFSASRDVTLKKGANEFAFDVPTENTLSIVLRTWVTLWVDSKERGRDYTRIIITADEPLDDFVLIGAAWGGVDGSSPAYLDKYLVPRVRRDLNVKVQPYSARRCPYGIEFGSQSLPWGMGYVSSTRKGKKAGAFWCGHDPETMQRDFCIHHPEDLEQAFAQVRDRARRERKYSPFIYHISDEHGLSRAGVDLDYTPQTVSAFRDYLKRTYGTLKAVNERWGSNFTAWEKMVPLNSEQARKNPENYSAWLDWRIWMTKEFAKFTGKFQEICAKEDGRPRDVVVGTVSTQATGPYRCTEPHFEAPYLGVQSLHCGESKAFSAFYFNKHFPKWVWDGAGHDKPRERARNMLWNIAAHGCAVAWAWCPLMTAHQYVGVPTHMLDTEYTPIFDETMQITPQRGKVFYEDLFPIFHGVGKALITARHARADVAVLYNIRDEFIAFLNGQRGIYGYGTGGIQCAFHRVQDAQLHPVFVTEEQIEEGYLERGRFAAAYIPGQAGHTISTEMVSALEQFTKKGRLFVESPRDFATRDGSGRKRTGRKEIERFLQRLDRQPGGNRLEAVLAAVRKDKDFRVETKAGMLAPGLLVRTHSNGPLKYIAIVRDAIYGGHLPDEMTLKLKKPTHGYDMCKGVYLGHETEFPVNLERGAGVVFALAPYEVSGVSVRLSAPRAKPGDTLAYRIQVEPEKKRAGNHVVTVDVIGPDGEARDAYSGNLLTESGRIEGSIPLAVNDATGLWTISVRDVMSGKEAADRFLVAR